MYEINLLLRYYVKIFSRIIVMNIKKHKISEYPNKPMPARQRCLKSLACTAVIVLWILMTMALFSACSFLNKKDVLQTLPESTDRQVEEETGDNSAVSEVVEIEIWDKLEPGEQIELMNSIQKFMDNNKNIKIITRHFRSDEELADQFKAASLAGAGAEVILANLAISADLAKSKVIRQVPRDMEYAGIISGLAEISRFENNNYIIPFRAFDFLLLYYNKDLVSDVPANFNDLIQYCRQVNKPSENIWGFLFNLYEPEWVLPLVGGYQDWIYDYSTGSISLDSEAMTSMLKMLLKIYNEEKILPYGYGYEEINEAFINGNAHMIVNGNWATQEYLNAGIDFGVSKIPVVIEGFKNPTPMVDGIGFMFNANSYGREFEAASQLVSYLMSEEMQLSWTLKTKTLPVFSSIENLAQIKENEILYGQVQQLKICRGRINENVLRVIRDAIKINLENVMAGNISPEDAAVKMQEDAIKLLTGSQTNKSLNSPDKQAENIEN